MEITVNTKRMKLEKAVKLSDLPELLGIHYEEEERKNVFLSDNGRMLYEIPKEAVTEDGHKYVVFQLSYGG